MKSIICLSFFSLWWQTRSEWDFSGDVKKCCYKVSKTCESGIFLFVPIFFWRGQSVCSWFYNYFSWPFISRERHLIAHCITFEGLNLSLTSSIFCHSQQIEQTLRMGRSFIYLCLHNVNYCVAKWQVGNLNFMGSYLQHFKLIVFH